MFPINAFNSPPCCKFCTLYHLPGAPGPLAEAARCPFWICSLRLHNDSTVYDLCLCNWKKRSANMTDRHFQWLIHLETFDIFLALVHVVSFPVWPPCTQQTLLGLVHAVQQKISWLNARVFVSTSYSSLLSSPQLPMQYFNIWNVHFASSILRFAI